MDLFLGVRLRLWLEDAVWLIPLLGVVFAWLLDLIAFEVDQSLFEDGVQRVISPDSASTLLVAIGGGMITFTGLVFSLVLLVLQYGSTAYSPRAVSYLLRARSTQWILAVFLATIVFCFISVPKVGSFGRRNYAPVASVTVGALLLIASLVGFIVLLHLVGKRIRVDNVLTALGRDARHGLRRRAMLQERPDITYLDAITPTNEVQVHYEGPPGQIVGLSVRAMVRLASANKVRLVLLLRIGDAVSTGSQFATVSAPVSARALSRCLLVRSERAMHRDPLYALRIITDISLRALSPAVNDPTTATRALDEVEGVLRTAATMHLGPVAITGDAWEVQIPLPTWTNVVNLALMEVVDSAVGQPQVTRRLVALIDDLVADTTPDRHEPLMLYRRRLVRGVQERVAPEYREMSLTPDRQGIGGSRALQPGASS